MTKESIADRFRLLQDHICGELEEIDGIARFNEDAWSRKAGGGGRTRTLANGAVIEKGGVAFSEVFGEVTPVMKKQLGLDGETFFATGVSIVLHPENPHVPIIHMNVRYFELNTGVYWFGGGIDLTPHYIIPEQAGEFHRSLATVCEKYSPDFYPRFKVWADDYFFNTHRNETRGVGGLFFDDLHGDFERDFAYLRAVGDGFLDAYLPLVERRRDTPYGERERAFQLYRRGRYVEFNLVWDRGTHFGLQSGGRSESILLSMPPLVSWAYNRKTKKGTPEDRLYREFLVPRDWV